MKIFIGTDETTSEVKELVSFLENKGHELTLGGHLLDEALKWHWAEIGLEGAKKVSEEQVDIAVLFCWSGTGVCIAANKLDRVRAALCDEPETARLARKWDDANVLCLALRKLDLEKAIDTIDTFLTTSFDEENPDQVRYLN